MRWRPLFLLPVHDVLRGLDRCLAGGAPALVRVFAGCVAGWWAYVPCHELLHALACVATGGRVTRLEIAPLYGGRLLARLFPFIAATGERAGSLTGFDTRGSDLIYLATDLGPFLLTLFPGIWLLRTAARRGWSVAFGLSLPVALAPFVSLTGDAYEIGSILVTRLPAWSSPALTKLLRGDDWFAILAAVRQDGSVAAWGGTVLAAIVGAIWALATYLAGSGIASGLGAGPLESPPV